MSKIKFVNFNGIQEYARVMYNDVKDADKHRIEVAYNGRDIKDLLEYLFKLEEEIERLNNIIKEVREMCNSAIGNNEESIVSKNKLLKIILEILNKGE